MPTGKRILIVGGVAGGASAAARARRLSEDAEIVLFERGEHISFANCGLPYHIGGTIDQRDRLLVQTPEAMQKRFRIDVRTRTEVTAIDRAGKTITAANLETGQQSAEPYDVLILSPGAAPFRPPIPGAEDDRVFTLRNLRDMDAINAAVARADPARAVVVGGGYIGLEMVEALSQRRLDVTVVELAEQVFVAADPEIVAPVHQQLELHGVDLRLGTSVTEMRDEDGRLRVILTKGDPIDAGLVILAVGVRPENGLAKAAGLEIGQTGGIVVDEHTCTSDPNIFAVGDAVEVTHRVGRQKALIPLAGPANRQGRIAAENALGRKTTYSGTQGTAICKVFDLAIGMTGLGETALKRADIAYEKVFVHPASHAGYYPGAMPLTLKLLFDPKDGAILGAQAVGAKGVDKRIDVIAVAIRAGLSVHDLAELELSYAPPYGSAKDPVNYAGFVAENVLLGDVKLCHVDDVNQPADDQFLLDVRTKDELEAGTIPGAANVPLDDLRDRLGELPQHRELLVYCQAGLRGYLACRILSQRGFRCRNLSGGYKTYRAAMGLQSSDAPKLQPTDGPKPNDAANCPTSGNAKCDPPREAARGGEQFEIVQEIDAAALQCPGPIMRLREAVDAIEAGQAVSIVAGDPGFPADVKAWCQSTGNRLVEVTPQSGGCRATILKEGRATPEATHAGAPAGACEVSSKKKTIVLFSGDLDKALAGFIIANGAAAMGSEVTIFFTFWGLNILRKPQGAQVKKGAVEQMFGWMMPRGADQLKLSKMNMGGMGAAMIKGIMRRKNVSPLPELIRSAQEAGVRLIACSMSMELMGIRREELLDGIDEGGVAMYLSAAEAGNVNLFI